MGAAATKIVQARRARPQTGQEEMIGQLGVVREPLAPTGTVFVHGEIWRAHTEGDPVPTGAIVRVDAISDGLLLEVSRAEETVAATA
jgi:membrane-bound serine protease (ClpP class)